MWSDEDWLHMNVKRALWKLVVCDLTAVAQHTYNICRIWVLTFCEYPTSRNVWATSVIVMC